MKNMNCCAPLMLGPKFDDVAVQEARKMLEAHAPKAMLIPLIVGDAEIDED